MIGKWYLWEPGIGGAMCMATLNLWAWQFLVVEWLQSVSVGLHLVVSDPINPVEVIS